MEREERLRPMERIPHSLSEQGLLGDQDLPVFQETTHPGTLAHPGGHLGNPKDSIF